MKKMTKAIVTMVSNANEMIRCLQDSEQKGQRQAVEALVTYTLIDLNMYHGFRYYEETAIGLMPADKETTIPQFIIV